tara:strand:+ start:41 stop:1393 length:1353 start_codon:yes stop_codon:yes gene_type:complete
MSQTKAELVNGLSVNTALDDAVTIDSSGNVGIGTSSPDSLGSLTVSQSATAEQYLTLINESDYGYGIGIQFKQPLASSGSVITSGKILSDWVSTNNSIMSFYTTGSSTSAERMRIDSSGRVLAGTSSARTIFKMGASGNGQTPKFQFETANDDSNNSLSLTYGRNNAFGAEIFIAKHRGASVGGTTIVQGGDRLGALTFTGSDGTNFQPAASIEAEIDATPGTDDMPGRLVFSTTADGAKIPTERMRIDSGGKVFIATTTRGVDASASNLAVYGNSSTTTGNVAGSFFGGAVSSARHVIVFSNSTGVTGSIATNGSQTDYNTSSDYRLKENVVAISDGITRLKTLKPIRFNFIKDASTTIDGFLAHEVSDAIPAAVTGEKDGMAGETYYEEGDTLPNGKEYGDVKTYSTTQIEPQQLDQSKLVPLLTAALQEAITKIETLETKVAALEAA